MSKQNGSLLFSQHVKQGNSKYALTCYQKLRDNVFHHACDSMFIDILQACGNVSDLQTGWEIHSEISRRNLLERDVFVGSTLVNMYAKCGALAKAEEVFDMLPSCDVVTWTALIGGYAEHGRGEEALLCFKEMQLQGIFPNAVTFVCALKGCGISRQVHEGKKIHAQVARIGWLKSHFSLGSTLIDMYWRCGFLAVAQEVFDVLVDKDVVTWTALISGYTHNNLGKEALFYFEQMQCEGVPPNALTYVCTLKACGIIGSVDKTTEIHSHVARRELLKTNHFVGNALVDAYVKFGLLAKARELFNEFSLHDVVGWNALISGYVDHELSEEALTCLRQMQHEHVVPDAITFSCCLKACGTAGATNKGREIHVEISRRGLLTKDLFLGTALVDMYGKCGLAAKAHDVVGNLHVRDVTMWTALIAAFAQLGKAECVLNLIDLMRGEVEPSAVTFVEILMACSHEGFVDIGVACFRTMIEDYNTSPGIEHLTCMVDLLGRAGQLERAIKVVREAPWHPDIALWLSMLGACQKWSNQALGEQAFAHVVLLDVLEVTAYVTMCNIYIGGSS